MNKTSRKNIILFLICLVVFICIVLIVHAKHSDNFVNRGYPNYAYEIIDINPNARNYLLKNPQKITLRERDYNAVMNYYFDRPQGMSWEGDATLNNPVAKAIAERVYRRDCPVPVISRMPKYNPLQPNIPDGFKPGGGVPPL